MKSSPHPKPAKTAQAGKRQKAAMEEFVRLQQMQEEYLKWLEAGEKNDDLDRYVYKKIR